MLESLVRAKKNKVRLVKLDPSFMPKMAQKYQVEHFPTLMLLKDGQVVEQRENPVAEEEKEFVDKATAFASLDSMKTYRKRLVSKHEKTIKHVDSPVAIRFKLAAEQMQEIITMFHWIDLERKKNEDK